MDLTPELFPYELPQLHLCRSVRVSFSINKHYNAISKHTLSWMNSPDTRSSQEPDLWIHRAAGTPAEKTVPQALSYSSRLRWCTDGKPDDPPTHTFICSPNHHSQSSYKFPSNPVISCFAFGCRWCDNFDWAERSSTSIISCANLFTEDFEVRDRCMHGLWHQTCIQLGNQLQLVHVILGGASWEGQ